MCAIMLIVPKLSEPERESTATKSTIPLARFSTQSGFGGDNWFRQYYYNFDLHRTNLAPVPEHTNARRMKDIRNKVNISKEIELL